MADNSVENYNEKPSHLYAWTDSNITGVYYYAWTHVGIYGSATLYTLTDTPIPPVYYNDIFFFDGEMNSLIDSDNVLEEFDTSTTPTRIGMSYDGGGIEYYYRDESQDKIIYTIPRTVYTDTETVSNGMTLYDNNGNDNGYVVGNISNNSFDISKTNDSGNVSDPTAADIPEPDIPPRP